MTNDETDYGLLAIILLICLMLFIGVGAAFLL
jgi:hypothetical protein